MPAKPATCTKSALPWLACLAVGLLGLWSGCSSERPHWNFHTDAGHYQDVALQMESPTEQPSSLDELDIGGTPNTIRDADKVQYQDMTLEEVLRIAMCNSRVMHDLGATVLHTPDDIHSTYDPAIIETDPLTGVEAALSAFDAQFNSGLYFEKNDRRYNNTFFGQSVPVQDPNNPNGPPTNVGGFYSQEYDTFVAALTKKAATGDQFTVRNFVDFDHNNSLGNFYQGGAWDVYVEGEVRHPFLRGAGVETNRIVGPNGRPGVMNGVLLARVKTDMGLADFETGVRFCVADVENAYWDLYYAYRYLDIRVRARNAALDTWRKIHSLNVAGQRGGEADKEAQAREQYFHFEEEVQTAITGRGIDGTRSGFGTNPGIFRPFPGVFHIERRLRRMIGLPLNDCRVIRPADEPAVSPMTFDWCAITGEALMRRPELRRQRWLVKQCALEAQGARNFLLPNLDIVGRYRLRGFGQNLIGPDAVQFDSAYGELGKFQEWQMGAEFSMPLGFRQEHAAVRNAEVRECRARAILLDQEKEVIFELSNAVAEVDRGYSVLQTSINRLIAAHEALKAVEAAYDASPDAAAQFTVVLDLQRRYADAEIEYYVARIDYALALRNVYFEKGTLLDDRGVFLAEGPSPPKAYCDAAALDCRRGRPREINYSLQGHPSIVSAGPVPAGGGSPAMMIAPVTIPPAEAIPTPGNAAVAPTPEAVVPRGNQPQPLSNPPALQPVPPQPY